MAALTGDRNAVAKEQGRSISVRLAADAVIYKGAMVRRNAAGFGIPADDAANGTDVIGVSEENVNNTGGANGDVRCRVRKGVFGFQNNGNVVQATEGLQVTAVDDQTVGLAADTTNDHIVGVVDDFSDDGLVYVHIQDS